MTRALSPLAKNEINFYRSIKKTACVLLVLIKLDRPTGSTEISKILGIHTETASIHLRSLSQLGVITRAFKNSGYILTVGGRQMLLGVDQLPETAENPRLSFKASSSSSLNKKENDLSKEEEEKILETTAENPRSNNDFLVETAENPRARENFEVLQEYGVNWNKTVSKLCNMDHVTPDHIHNKAQEIAKRGKFSPGMLITVCSDPPAPNQNRSRQRYAYEWNNPDINYTGGEYS